MKNNESLEFDRNQLLETMINFTQESQDSFWESEIYLDFLINLTYEELQLVLKYFEAINNVHEYVFSNEFNQKIFEAKIDRVADSIQNITLVCKQELVLMIQKKWKKTFKNDIESSNISNIKNEAFLRNGPHLETYIQKTTSGILNLLTHIKLFEAQPDKAAEINISLQRLQLGLMPQLRKNVIIELTKLQILDQLLGKDAKVEYHLEKGLQYFKLGQIAERAIPELKEASEIYNLRINKARNLYKFKRFPDELLDDLIGYIKTNLKIATFSISAEGEVEDYLILKSISDISHSLERIELSKSIWDEVFVECVLLIKNIVEIYDVDFFEIQNETFKDSGNLQTIHFPDLIVNFLNLLIKLQANPNNESKYIIAKETMKMLLLIKPDLITFENKL